MAQRGVLIVAGFVAGTVVGALSTPGSTLAQQIIGQVIVVEGQVTRAAAGESPVALKFRDRVFSGDRITTSSESLLKMLIGGKALLTLREVSEVVITDEPNKTTIDMAANPSNGGKVAVNLNKGSMKPGENIEIRTPNAIARVRGSAVVETNRTGTETHVDGTDVSAAAIIGGVVGSFLQIPPGQGLTITNMLGPLRPVRPNVSSGLQGKARSGTLSGAPLLPVLVQSSVAVTLLSADGKPVPLDSIEPKYRAYSEQVRQFINAKWGIPCIRQGKECDYKATEIDVEFSLFKDGGLAYIKIMRASPWQVYNDYAVNAIKLASPFPPVPDALLQGKGLLVSAQFKYTR